MKLTPVLLVALVALTFLALTPSQAAASTPATSAATITTSAPPVNFVGTNETYVVMASVPASNWTVSGSGTTISYTPGSQQAVVHLFASAGTETVSIEAMASGYTPAWQNWSLTTYSLPFVSSIPAYYVTAGQFYNYSPTFSGSGFWSFAGAPYLHLTSLTEGTLTGTVTGNGTYTNRLTLNTTSGNFTQVWVTTTGDAATLTPTFGCYVGSNPVTATVALGPYAAGCGNVGLFQGEYPVLTPVHKTQHNTLNLTVPNGAGYYAYVSATPASPLLSGVQGWFYGSPGTSSSIYWNGALVSSGTYPSSGFVTNSTFPAVQPGPTPAGPTVQISPGSGATGIAAAISGSSFTSSAEVTVRFGSTVLTATVCAVGTISAPYVVVTGAGAFSCTFTVPSVANGTYSVTATDSISSKVATTYFTVTLVSPTPSSTVSNIYFIVLGGLVLVAGAIVLVAAKDYRPVGAVLAAAGVAILVVLLVPL